MPSLRPCSTTAVSASSQARSVRIFIGMTAGPLVAKRMRRTCGIASSASPISVMILRAELIRVAAGDDDVFEFGARGDVVEGAPATRLGVLRERDFIDVVGVEPDRVRARAEAAVDRARVERQEQRLVDVAVREAGDRRVVLFVQRVERQPRMIGQQLRGERDELRADRIVVRLRPIDRGDHVRRDADRHRRALEAVARVVDERRLDEIVDRLEQLVGRLDRVAAPARCDRGTWLRRSRRTWGSRARTRLARRLRCSTRLRRRGGLIASRASGRSPSV